MNRSGSEPQWPCLRFGDDRHPQGNMEIGENSCLRHSGIDIWATDLNYSEEEIQHLANCLSASETARADRLRTARDRNRYVARHGILRLILSAYFQCAPPEVEIRSNDKGKPYVVDGAHNAALQFSMSHSASLAVFAFGRYERIGIDIEKISGFPEMLEVAALNFTSTEIKEIYAAPEGSCDSTFFKLWTRKEALLKASGDGVLLPLSCVDGSTPRGELKMWRKKIKGDSSGREYSLMDVMVAPGFAAAVAACCTGNGFGINYKNYLSRGWNRAGPG